MGPNSFLLLIRITIVLTLGATLAACGSGNGQDSIPGDPVPGFRLIFADEFDQNSPPDPAIWNIETGYGPNNDGWGNNEWQLYTDEPENVRVEDGYLVIEAQCPVEPCGVRDGTVTSARINTTDKFEFKYGKVVARIKPPVGEGTWPAFWSLGANFPEIGWPRSGEIDFMELFQGISNPRTTHTATHWCDQTRQAPATCAFPEGRALQTQSKAFPDSLGDDFHVWEVEWDADRITARIDGIPYFDFVIDPEVMEEFRREFFMLLNIATGGDLGSAGQPPSGNEVWPQTMLVDYIRVYQKIDGYDDGVEGGDTTPPTLTDVTIGSNNADRNVATTGDSVIVVFTADEPIATPRVTIGGIAADSVNGLGTDWQASRALTAADADGVIPFSIEFIDLASNPGVPATTTTDSTSVTLDTTAPTVTIEGAPAAFVSLDPLPVTFQFSEPVTGFEVGDIEVTNGAAGNLAGNGATYTADITPTGVGSLVIGVAAGAAVDAVGIASEAAADVIVTSGLDNPNAPLLTTVSIASDNVNAGFAITGDTVTITMIANESITQPTVTIGGAPADLVTGDDANWSATRTTLAADSEGEIAFVISNFQAEDDGTPGFQTTVTTDGSSVIFDVTPPTLSIDGLPSGTIQFLDPIAVTFQFDEDVIGFDESDIQVNNGTVGAFAVVDAATYTADITPDGVGDLNVSVAAAAATDGAGNTSAGASETRAVDAQAWRLIWSDDFDGGGLDAANWTARTDADCPPPCDGVQSYLSERVTVAGGVLTIEARDEGGAVYTSGLIDTRGKLESKFGRIEIDAQMPGTIGTLPSLWLLPANEAFGPWPQSGEIDIVNAPNLLPGNTTLEHTLRYGLPEPEDTVTTATSVAPGLPTLELIEYAIEWEGGEIRWFVNDVHVATQIQDNWYAFFEDNDGVYTLGADAEPFDQDFYVLIGLPVGSNAGGGSAFPQSLVIDAVRVYECANPLDPALGTGCSTGTGVPPEDAPGAPYSEMLEVYTDAPAVLEFEGPGAMTTASQLVPDTSVSAPGVIVNSTINAMDNGNTIWNVNIDALGGTGRVFMRAGDFPAGRGFFDLSGGATAGELLFRMRVNSATGVSQLAIGLDSATGSGRDLLNVLADGVWRNYSVKIADVVQGVPVNLAEIANLFVLEASGGAVDLDLDDVEVKVTCRDQGGCQATPRIPSEAEPTVEYSQDFEGMTPAQGDPPNDLSDDGWLVGANVFDPTGTTEIGEYFAFPAPNGGPAFSAVVDGQGGTEQGNNQLSVYNDYNNPIHGDGSGNIIEAILFRPIGVIGAGDVGQTWTLSFEVKQGNQMPPSTSYAYIKVIESSANFADLAIDSFDTTAIGSGWTGGSVSLVIDAAWVGETLEIGFATRATNFDPSGVFYDNIAVSAAP